MGSTTDRRWRAAAVIVALLLVTATSSEVASMDAHARASSSYTPHNSGDLLPRWKAQREQQYERRAALQVDTIAMLLPALPGEAARLDRCARHTQSIFDRSCGSRLCVHCETRKREQWARRAERALAEPEGVKLLLTCTIGSTTIADGLRDLRAALTRLRSSVAWTVVLVSAFAIEVDRVQGERPSGARWNVHTHAVVIVEAGSAVSGLGSAWSRTWTRAVGARGSLDVRRWVRDPRWRGRGDGAVSYAAKPWRALVVPEDGLSAADLVEKVTALRGRRLRGIVSRRGVA